MQEINKKMLNIADSPDIYEACEKVGQVFGLHIDQISELDFAVRNVFRGKGKANEFTSRIVEALETDRTTAEKITAEVNKRVFEVMKNGLKEQSIENFKSNTSLIEQAGGFEVEKTNDIEAVKHNEENINRDEVMSAIENPVPSPKKIVSSNEETHTEPLVDYLISGPSQTVPKEIKPISNNSAAATNTVKVQNPSAAGNNAATPAAAKARDMYREPID